MGKQVQKETAKQDTAEEEKAQAPADLKNPELDEDVDDLLAEIDGVLEENAEEFVKGYVQKGGQ